MKKDKDIGANNPAGQEWDAQIVDQIINSLKHLPGALLPILHALQTELGFIPNDVKPIIATALNVSVAEVHGVISFYHFFRSTPPGTHVLQICRAESCQAMNSRALETYVKNKLGIAYHQTTADGMFSLEPVYCLGNCACSPSIRIDDHVMGDMDNQKFDTLISELTTHVVEVK